MTSLLARAVGPFKILEVFNQVNYKIVSIQSKKEYVVHYNRLRPYRCRFGMEEALAVPVKKKSKVVMLIDEVQIEVVVASRFWQLVRSGQERAALQHQQEVGAEQNQFRMAQEARNRSGRVGTNGGVDRDFWCNW